MIANMKTRHSYSSQTMALPDPSPPRLGKLPALAAIYTPSKVIYIFLCGLIYATKVDVLIMPHFMLEFALDKLAAPRGGCVLLRSEPRRLKSALPLLFRLRVRSCGEK